MSEEKKSTKVPINIELTEEFAQEYMDIVSWNEIDVKEFKKFSDDTIVSATNLIDDKDKKTTIFRTVILEDNRIDLFKNLLGKKSATIDNVSELLGVKNMQSVVMVCIGNKSDDIIYKIHKDNVANKSIPIYNFTQQISSEQHATPLSYSIACGNTEMAEFFLENGATWAYQHYLAASALCAKYEGELFEKYFHHMYMFVEDNIKPQLLAVVGGYEFNKDPKLPKFKSLIQKSHVGTDALAWLFDFVTQGVKDLISDISQEAINAMVDVINDVSQERGSHETIQDALESFYKKHRGHNNEKFSVLDNDSMDEFTKILSDMDVDSAGEDISSVLKKYYRQGF